MKRISKQWLMVIVIIISLGIILLPMINEDNIFSQSVHYILAKFPVLPKPPMFCLGNTLNKYDPNPTNAEVKTAASAWVVVVHPGDEQKQDLAKLVTLLQKNDLAAFLSTSDQLSHNMQVLIGPEFDKNEADSISQKVNGLFNLKTDIVKYNLLEL